MNKKFTSEDDELLAELGIEVETKKVAKLTPKEERIIAGFEEVQKFFEKSGHAPRDGEEKDIFERLYAVRLDSIRKQQECLELLKPYDHHGLLEENLAKALAVDELDDDALLEELGVSVETQSITELKHVRSSVDKRAAEEIAHREKCKDFEKFKPLFDSVQHELDTGFRETQKFRRDAGFTKTDIKKSQFFILGGQTAYVAEVGESIKAPNGDADARLRVVYSNGTESNILLRSVMRALYKDDTSRLISDPHAGPLFSDVFEDEDLASGTIYVLRSKSDHPVATEHRELFHKIGVTGGRVEKRIANAKIDPTFLMSDVEVVATYELYNISRSKLENVIHRFFEPAKMEIEIKDRFGKPVVPREWFLVPLFIIDEAVNKIKDSTIADYIYDPNTAKILKR